MLKRRNTLLCFAHGEGEREKYSVLMIEEQMTSISDVTGVRRLYCDVDFWAPYKIAKLFVETATHGAVLSSQGRSEHDGCNVL